MGRSAEPAIERRRQIIEILRAGSTIDTATLAGQLGVGLPAIRRDLKALETQNKVLRSYGGTLPAPILSVLFWIHAILARLRYCKYFAVFL